MKRKFSILLAVAMVMPTVAPTFATLYATEVTTQAEEKQVLQTSKIPLNLKEVDNQAKTVQLEVVAMVNLKKGIMSHLEEKTLIIEGPHYMAEGATLEVYSNPSNELKGFTTKDKTPIVTAKTNKEGKCTLTLNKNENYCIVATYVDPNDNENKYETRYAWSFKSGEYTGYFTVGFLPLSELLDKPVTGTIQAVTSAGQPVTLQNATMQLFEGTNKENLKHKETVNCKEKYNINLEDNKVYWVAVYGSDAEGNGYSYEGYLPDPDTIKEPQNLTLKPCPIMYLEASTGDLNTRADVEYIDIYVNRNGNKCFMGNPPAKGGEIVYLLGNDDDKIDLYFEIDGKEIKPIKNPVENMTIKQFDEKEGYNGYKFETFVFDLKNLND